MRIVTLDLTLDPVSSRGLRPIRMNRLGQVVAVAGPNGAGKSRLLTLVSESITRKGVPSSTRRNVYNWQTTLVRDPLDRAAGASLNAIGPLVDGITYDLDEAHIDNIPVAVSFVPPDVTLRDARQLSKSDSAKAAGVVRENVGFGSTRQGTVAYLEEILNREWEVSHQRYDGNAVDKARAIDELERLQEIVRTVMGGDLRRDHEGNVMLFGMLVGAGTLSQGQTILLQFCVALHAQGTRLDECILFLDEPERHLHPAALVDTIGRLQTLVTRGQIWIATHSVHVLAHVDPASIWYMADGRVEYAGRTPERVLRGLLGDEEQVARLYSFMGEPGRHAVILFALECLLPPATVATTTDAQSTQMTRILLDDFGQRQKCIVDYGAGRGRLLAALSEVHKPTLPRPLSLRDGLRVRSRPIPS